MKNYSSNYERNIKKLKENIYKIGIQIAQIQRKIYYEQDSEKQNQGKIDQLDE